MESRSRVAAAMDFEMPLQPLSEIFAENVSNDPDVVAAKERRHAELDRLGLASIKPIVSKYVGVCFEESAL